MPKRLLGALAASIAMIAAGGLTPAPAYAEANPPGCPSGYFCMYSGVNQTGTLLVKTAGFWGGRQEGVKSVFNNGTVCHGCDHVYMTYYNGQRNEGVCIHHNPGPGAYKWNYSYGIVVKAVEWQGEC